MTDLIRQFFELNGVYFHILEQSPRVSQTSIRFPPANKALLASVSLPKGLQDFYALNDGMKMEWEADRSQDVVGRLHISTLEHFLAGLKAIDSSVQEGEEVFEFHPVDFFADEACCGLFIRNGQVEDRMYYYTLGETGVTDLGVDFAGYLTLANETHGFRYWPLYLLEYIKGHAATEETERFRAHAPELLKFFDLDGFNKKIDALKL